MKPDLNQSEKISFENVSHEPKSVEVSQNALILNQFEQALNKLPADEKKKILTELYQHAALSAYEKTNVLKAKGEKVAPLKKLIFGWHGSKHLLTLILLDIDKEIQIFVDRTLIHVFINMLISKDLSQHHEQMHIKCLSTEFKCIMENLSLHCKSFTPTTIEKSNAFISSCGTLINANYLYNTSTDHVHNKKLIESIFRKYC